MIFVCTYLRFKQYLNIIWRKLAVLSLNKLEGFCVLSKKIGGKSKKLAEFYLQDLQLFGCIDNTSLGMDYWWEHCRTVQAEFQKLDSFICFPSPFFLSCLQSVWANCSNGAQHFSSRSLSPQTQRTGCNPISFCEKCHQKWVNIGQSKISSTENLGPPNYG